MYELLKEEMRKQGLSTRQVAIKAGITPQGLYAAINGRCEFWKGWKDRVALALGCSSKDLFVEADRKDLALIALKIFKEEYGDMPEFASVIVAIESAERRYG